MSENSPTLITYACTTTFALCSRWASCSWPWEHKAKQVLALGTQGPQFTFLHITCISKLNFNLVMSLWLPWERIGQMRLAKYPEPAHVVHSLNYVSTGSEDSLPFHGVWELQLWSLRTSTSPFYHFSTPNVTHVRKDTRLPHVFGEQG